MAAILQTVKVNPDELKELIIRKAKDELHTHNGKDPIGTAVVKILTNGENEQAVKDFSAVVIYETNGAGPRPKS